MDCGKCWSECNARGNDVTKHCCNMKIMGRLLEKVLKTVTSQHYQPFVNSYFTNIATKIIVQ
jgi:hypothetical protein